jgi:hypothetical protein
MKPIIAYSKAKIMASQQSNLVATKNYADKPNRKPYLLFDSFRRANSTTSLGNAETTNNPYTVIGTATTVWGIQNNQAYVVSTSAAGRSIAYQELNEADCLIETDIAAFGSFNNGLAFRVVDKDNFWLVTISPTSFSLNKYIATAVTNVVTINKTFTPGRLSVYLKGNKIEVYLDGFLLTRVYDSFQSTATKHGLYTRADDSLSFRWKNFSVKTLAPVNYRLKEGFENALSSWYWSKETAGLSYSQTFSSVIKKSNNNSFRIELHKDDPDVSNSRRCEIALPSEESLEEHWYGVSIYLPNGGDEDYLLDTSPESLIQWHTTPDSGEQNVSPPLSLQTKNGRYNIAINSDAGRMSSQSSPYTLTPTTQDIGSYLSDKGTWVDWAFHVKWGYLPEHDPITEVYKNGVLVYQNNGIPNCMNDQVGVYTKVGIYKWDWHNNPASSIINKRVVYYDDFWMK